MITRQCWLIKSEPDCFSIQHLAKCPKQTTSWSGVRNYQARNFMRAMKKGDCVLFCHSSTDPPAIAGTAMVAREAYPDSTARNPQDDHYDSKASRENPIWDMVDIRLYEIFPAPVPISELRSVKELAGMELLRTGSRLSVQPVRPREFEIVMQLARAAGKAAKRAGPGKKSAPAKAIAKRAKSSGRKK
ncbi:MAG: EVE domain-containing protein [Pirellulales bacterium]